MGGRGGAHVVCVAPADEIRLLDVAKGLLEHPLDSITGNAEACCELDDSRLVVAVDGAAS